MIFAQVEPVNQVVEQAADTLQQAVDSAVQIVTDSAAAIAAATAPVAEAAEPIVKELSVWELIKAGGWWIMVPLALLAIVSIYIFFERLFAINHAPSWTASRNTSTAVRWNKPSNSARTPTRPTPA